MSEDFRLRGVAVGVRKEDARCGAPTRRARPRRGVWPLDRARLARMSEAGRASQLDARQLLHDYVEGLWADIEQVERPAVGEKYQAIAAMRELTRALRAIAFEAVYNARE